jgi:ubiquinone/menaquinone biosynthesis C-methylase UbiE
MKFFEYLIKKVKKSTLLEKIVFICLVFLVIIMLSNIKSGREGFSDSKKEFIRKSGSNIFDNFYVGIYDDLVYSEVKNKYEVGKIMNSKKPTQESKILDIGCGTGHHVNLFNDYNISEVIGVDNSPAMIKKAQENYPKLNFKLCNALNSIEFPANSFTHITCLYFTIYYIKNKRQLLENCYNWLMPGGVLVLHLVDMNNFDPIVPVANPFVIVSPQTYAKERITKSTVKFNTLDYKSDFNLDKNIDANTTTLNKPNALFKETLKFKDSNKVRINEHKFYMASQKSILSLAREVGFSLKSVDEMIQIQYENNFLYTLVKSA